MRPDESSLQRFARRFMQIDFKAMGKRIKSMRRERSWTTCYLAERAQISTPTLQKAENCRSKISVQSWLAIAEALGITLDQLSNLENA